MHERKKRSNSQVGTPASVIIIILLVKLFFTGDGKIWYPYSGKSNSAAVGASHSVHAAAFTKCSHTKPLVVSAPQPRHPDATGVKHHSAEADRRQGVRQKTERKRPRHVKNKEALPD
ncbi:hypothetical protein DFJ77DRAFT_539390 [Powellomyces hirtus]|nr:hypothetical protein DFJ77DRAFT_539390 [Powellomyces hirtus]